MVRRDVRATLSWAIGLLALAASCHTDAPRGTLPDSVSLAEYAVSMSAALVSRGRAYCSATRLRGGVVITAAHCVDGVPSVRVAFLRDWDEETSTFTGSRPYWVGRIDEDQDIALLEPRELIFGSGVDVSPSDPMWGQPVMVVGSPVGLPFSVNSGIVSHPERRASVFSEQHWYQISADVSPGNSGGGVFDAYGRLLGVVSFRIVSSRGDEAHLAGIVHTAEIRRFVESD